MYACARGGVRGGRPASCGASTRQLGSTRGGGGARSTADSDGCWVDRINVCRGIYGAPPPWTTTARCRALAHTRWRWRWRWRAFVQSCSTDARAMGVALMGLGGVLSACIHPYIYICHAPTPSDRHRHHQHTRWPTRYPPPPNTDSPLPPPWPPPLPPLLVATGARSNTHATGRVHLPLLAPVRGVGRNASSRPGWPSLRRLVIRSWFGS